MVKIVQLKYYLTCTIICVPHKTHLFSTDNSCYLESELLVHYIWPSIISVCKSLTIINII